LDRIWVAVEARLPHRAADERHRGVSTRRWLLAAAALGALAVFAFWPASKPQPAADLLLLVDGSQFDRVAANVVAETRRFSDGSSLRVEADGEVVSLASTPREFIVLLERGRAHFHVVPGGPRRWTIEVGLGRIEVVGTEFSIERRPERVIVAVNQGSVLVRSALLENAVKAVGPGERVVLGLTERDTNGALPAAPTGEEGVPRQTVGPIGSHGGLETPEPPSTDVVGSLFDDADRARLARDFERAARILDRVANEHPADARAALASYGHGVLALRQLGRPDQAVASFRRALGLGAPRTLREDCYLGWLEAELGRGDRARANESFARYLDEFPKGTHRLEMQRLLGSDQARPE
jgi:transmembrane sensor